MARKHKRAEMTFASDAEIVEFDEKCEELGYSRSDALRLAVNMAFKLGWDVPLWRKPEVVAAVNGKKRGRKKKVNG